MDRQVTYDLFVSNIDPAVSQDELQAVFESHGQINSVSFVPNKEGFDTAASFVRFLSETAAESAASALHGTVLNGRQLKIRKASRWGTTPSQSGSEHADNDSHQQQRSRHSGHHAGGTFQRGRHGYGGGFRGGIRGGHMASIRGGNRLPGTTGETSSFGQVGDFESMEDSHSPTFGGKQEPEYHVHMHETEEEQIQPEQEQPERTVQLMVTHVENGCMFWGMVAETECVSTIAQLQQKLQQFCPNAETVKKPVQSQIYGAVYSGDQMFYRCKILTKKQNTVSVFFVDFGNSEEVALTSLRMLSNELRAIPAVAQHFRLHGLQLIASESEKAVEYMKANVTDKLLQAYFFKGLGGLIPVELIEDNGQSLNKVMEEKGLLKRQSVLHATTPREKAPVKTKGQFDKHHGTDVVQQTTSWPDKQNNLAKVAKADENAKEIERLTAELRKMSVEMEAEKERMKILMSEVESEKQRHEQEMSDVLQSVLQSRFEALVQQMKTVKTVRASLPGQGNSQDPLEVAIELVTDDDSRIQADAIDPLQNVQDGVELLEQTQAEIKECTAGEVLDNLIGIRNATRRKLAASITELLDYIASLPCDVRSGDLVDAKAKILQTCTHGKLVQSGAYQQVAVKPMSNAIDAYHGYKTEQEQQLYSVQEATIACSENLCQVLKKFGMDLSFDTLNEEASDGSEETAHLDDLFEALTSAIDDEVEESKGCLSDPNDCIQAAAVAVLQSIDDELMTISHLKNELYPYYAAMYTSVSQWLDVRPDVEPVTAIRRHIKTLRRSLRHKEVHLRDLEEGDATDRSEIDKVEQETADLRLQLHYAFEEEHNLLVELSSLSKEHFPEIPVLHSELGIDGFEATGGLYRAGLSLEHYDRQVVSLPGCSVPCMKSTYCGQPCLLKEYSVTDVSAKESLDKEIVRYGMIRHPNLMPVTAMFYDSQRMKVYVQTGYYDYLSLSSWLQDSPTLAAKYNVVTGILKAINSLHTHSMIHGSVSAESVWVVPESDKTGDSFLGGIKGVLTDYDFAQSVTTRAASVAGAQGQSHYASSSFDVYCLGLVATKILYSEMQQDPVVSDFVTKMLLGSPVTRPKTEDLVNHPYVLNPPEVVEIVVRSDEDMDLSANGQAGELSLPDAVIDAQQQEVQHELLQSEGNRVDVNASHLPDVSSVSTGYVTAHDPTDQLASLLGVSRSVEGDSSDSSIVIVSPATGDVSPNQDIDTESIVD